MSLTKVIIRNVAAGWVGRIVLIISVIITTPILISHFGKYDYGIWLIVGQGSSLLMLLDFGIANSVSRFVSKNIALKKETENNRVYSTAIAIFSIFAILIIIFLLIIIPFVPDILNIVETKRHLTYWVFGLTGLNVAMIFPLRVGRGLLQAKDRYDMIALVEVIHTLARLILILLFFRTGNRGLIFLALISIIVNLSKPFVIYLIATKKYYPGLKFKFSNITKKNFQEMASLGNSAFLQTISGFIWAKFPAILVGGVLGISLTPLFGIPNSLLLKISPFITRLGATFVPIASRLDAKNKKDELTKLNMTGVRYGLMVSIPICVFFIFFGNDLLSVWLGRTGLSENDINLMSFLLIVMVIPFSIGVPQIATRSILNATGKHWISAISQFVCSVIGISIGFSLMKYTELGVLGIAIGWALKIVLSDILIFPYLCCKILKISGINYFKDVYLYPIFLGLFLSLICLIYRYGITNSTISGFIVSTMVYGSVTIIGIYFLGIIPEHRNYIFLSVKKGMSNFTKGFLKL